ncbi:MAG TPA: aldehyde dehydrogenase (NADP(+)) [Solirubrobacteraceae bacterium]|nr:aldehyde dehydrogenase (NADP(+)) [Solirubrobacteraceae bacterium]
MTDTTEIHETVADSSEHDVATAVAAAARIAGRWAHTPGEQRAAVLRRIADLLDETTDQLVDVADAETALGRPRLSGEVARTTGQLRMFADLVTRGAELDAIISEADASAARPDVRRVMRAIGPVAVFGASNFPFAFSVAGGDTASALAAGCPVLVKAHEGHPRTSRLTTEVIARALADAGAPTALLQTVYGFDAGRNLVLAPAIRAVGFTGSLPGGNALMKLTQTRPDPIPFYGELGSLNPVVVLEGAATKRPQELAEAYVGSLTLGVGQFCTNPGLMFVPRDETLVQAISAAVASATGSTMLTERIYDQFEGHVSAPVWSELDLVGRGERGDGPRSPTPQVRSVALDRFGSQLDQLAQERFGPAGLVVIYDKLEQVLELVPSLPGSLSGSVHAADAELDAAGRVADALAPKVGRLIFNGWPTGVAVCWAMHHGGPWPASTAPATTSVGATAIRRWLAPIAYQGFPDELLPDALRRSNPLGIERTVQP